MIPNPPVSSSLTAVASAGDLGSGSASAVHPSCASTSHFIASSSAPSNILWFRSPRQRDESWTWYLSVFISKSALSSLSLRGNRYMLIRRTPAWWRRAIPRDRRSQQLERRRRMSEFLSGGLTRLSLGVKVGRTTTNFPTPCPRHQLWTFGTFGHEDCHCLYYAFCLKAHIDHLSLACLCSSRQQKRHRMSWDGNMAGVFAGHGRLCPRSKNQHLDSFLRPVSWVVSGTSRNTVDCVVLSPYEAHALLPSIRQHKVVTLHVYSPRVTLFPYSCMWGRHGINKVWLRHLSLHEIVRLRDIAQIDYQPCALTPLMSSQIKFFRYLCF